MVIKDITLSIGTLKVNDYLFINFLMYFLLHMKQILSYMSRSPLERAPLSWGANKSLKLFCFVTRETLNSSPELVRAHLMGT